MKSFCVRTILLLSFINHAIASKLDAQDPVVLEAVMLAQNQLTQTLRREMNFLRRVVQLTPEQDKRLSNFDETKLESIRIQQRKVAPGVDFGNLQFQVNGGAVAVVQSKMDPLKMRQIERAFEKEVDLVLSAEQQATYNAEKKLRDDFYKEAAVRGLLIILDKRLSLSKSQRDEIYLSLFKWGEITSFDLTPYESSFQYLPPIPDSVLVDHLNDSQRKILSSTSRVDFGNQNLFQLPLQIDPENIR